MVSDLQKRFDFEMQDIYRRAKFEANYNATRYLQMLHEHGGLQTARILINAPTVSDGYTALWLRNRLDLTVEAIVFDNPEFHVLFTEEELNIVRRRLVDYDYRPATDLR